MFSISLTHHNWRYIEFLWALAFLFWSPPFHPSSFTSICGKNMITYCMYVETNRTYHIREFNIPSSRRRRRRRQRLSLHPYLHLVDRQNWTTWECRQKYLFRGNPHSHGTMRRSVDDKSKVNDGSETFSHSSHYCE